MTAYNFQIFKNNILKIDSYGHGSVNFGENDFPIPFPLKGIPDTLPELIKIIGASNIFISYYAYATGNVSGHGCICALNVQGDLNNSTNTNMIGIWSTDQGGIVDSKWQVLSTNVNSIITKLHCFSAQSGSGCWCAFESLGGWSGVQISLRLDVTANLINYCTKLNTQNIRDDVC